MSARSRSVLALAVGAVVCGQSVLAQETPVRRLGTIVVTGAPEQSPLTFMTDTKLPRQPVPASDGADYLKTIAGFGAIRAGGTNGDPVLRGMFGSRLNILTNDGAMPGACPARMDNPLSYVSPETYDRLVVIKGPQTVLWGPVAAAGTVRFERDMQASRFSEPGVKVNASLLGGSFQRNDQVLDVRAGAPTGYVRFSANRSDADDYQDGDGNTVESAWKKWNADVAVGWTPDERTVLEFSAGAGDGESRYAARSMDGSVFERTSYGLRFERTGFSGVLQDVQASAYYNRADHVMDNYSLRDPNPNSAMPMPVAANVERRTVGGRAAAVWQLAELELTTGVDAQDSRHRQRSGMGRNAHRAMPWETDAELANTGVFAEGRWQLADEHRTVFGARVDRARVLDRRAQTNGMMPMPNPTAGQTRRETLTGGFVRYEHDASAMPVHLYAGIGRAQRMPDYWEFFSADMGPMHAVNAFAALQPETTTQLDVGAQYRTARVDAWVSLYAGRSDDFILFSYGHGGMMGPMTTVSQVDATLRGGEAGVAYRPHEHWTVGTTVAYSWAQNRDTGTAMPQIPPLDARMTLAYDNTRWSAGAVLRLVDGQDRIAQDQGNVVGRDLGPGAGFAVLSLNAAYRFASGLSVTAGVDNVLDRNYTEHLNLSGNADFGYPADPVRINEPGRTAWVKLMWALGER